MWKPRLRLIVLYVIVLIAILGAVTAVRINSFARALDLELIDILRPLPTHIQQKKSATILILGVGGEGHDGPFLTDSITLARYSLSDTHIETLGIPRDMWDPEIQDKINSIYTYALQQSSVSPFTYTQEKFQNLLGGQIDYVVVVNFADFEQLIDLIGGITIHLDQGFVDPTFPIAGAENKECEPFDPDYGCRYQTLIFRSGDQKLNGTVALKFVRSRHAEGDAGSDFSRNKRQQIVITAIKTRLFELLKNRDFDTLLAVVSFLDAHIKRDMPNKEALALARSVAQRQGELTMGSTTLGEDLLEVPRMDEYEGRYVLIPNDNDYKRLQSKIEGLLSRMK